jgi:hypothetical protein
MIMSNNIKLQSDSIFIVSVDSRGTATTDMAAYKEHTCSNEFFQQHIHDNPKNVCVKSQVAGLCGLDLKLYFHQHSPYHHASHDDYQVHKPMCTNVNGIATLLTFNPDTGYYNHLVFGKAYVLLNDGKTPLSKEQVWGLQELITQAKTLYHRDGKHISEAAHQELLKWTAQYQAGTWAPHSIYEPRHPHRPVYYRFESGMSDQATCHHGCAHAHHDGHHKCCHHNEDTDDIWDTAAWDEAKIEYEEARNPDNHHIVTTSSSDRSRNHTPARHERNPKYNIYATGC